jgi:hypothetical protein
MPLLIIWYSSLKAIVEIQLKLSRSIKLLNSALDICYLTYVLLRSSKCLLQNIFETSELLLFNYSTTTVSNNIAIIKPTLLRLQYTSTLRKVMGCSSSLDVVQLFMGKVFLKIGPSILVCAFKLLHSSHNNISKCRICNMSDKR